MVAIRRWYVYLVCAISLQSVTWAVIALLRGLLIGLERPVTATAFEIAVIIVGLPLFLGHWLWAQRLAATEADAQERGSAVRRLYLYGTLAGFLAPALANAFALLRTLFSLALSAYRPDYLNYTAGQTAGRALAALAVLGLMWFYHSRVLRADSLGAPETGNLATVRRLYVLGFSAAGLWMSTLVVIHLLRWLMLQAGPSPAFEMGRAVLADELSRALVGVPAWLIFWRQAQRLFASQGDEERESAFRKLYLYGVVLVAVLGAVANATMILAGFFRRVVGLTPQGDLRQPLPIVIGMAVLWAYHTLVLRDDAAQAGEAPRQAGVRRLYLYLVAAIGLAALLIGLGGEVSVVIRSLAERVFGPDLREQVAWFTAALLAGLPVWLLPWFRAQKLAAGGQGREERQSLVRKIYLYFYLLVATLTVLSAAVYVAYRLLSRALGAGSSGNLVSDLAQAVAYLLIAVGVWLYHGAVLREDTRLARGDRSERLAGLRVAVVDGGDGRVGRGVLAALRQELPQLPVTAVGLTPEAAAAMEVAPGLEGLREVTLIVGSWEIAAALAAYSGRKLLIPVWPEGADWAGVERWSDEALARQVARAVKQLSNGEEMRLARPPGAGAIIGIIVAILAGLMLLMSVIGFVAERVF
ncbi:MAG: hypothetical protein HY872_16830 [Chloroflexi bacterium]|nr:hypothetical protein [Chloroflexota bacterium]